MVFLYFFSYLCVCKKQKNNYINLVLFWFHMKSHRLSIVFLILFLVSSLLVSGCAIYESSSSDATNSTEIIVSILPQIRFVEAVGGKYVQVHALIPPGASPATYEPKPSDLVAIEKAELYFQNGYLPFEQSYTSRIRSLNPALTIIDTSQGVTLHHFGEEQHEHTTNDEHEEDSGPETDVDHQEKINEAENFTSVDPHYWLSPRQVKAQISIIEQTLSEHDPTHRSYYEDRALQYKETLDELDQTLRRHLDNLTSRTFLVFHPSLGYIARDYNLTQVAIEHDGKDPTISQLQKTIQLAEDQNISVIFVQKQFNQNIARSVAEQIGAQVVIFDPLAQKYEKNMYAIAEQIKRGLNRTER
jgi:zinc transport system substrate-binding protein